MGCKGVSCFSEGAIHLCYVHGDELLKFSSLLISIFCFVLLTNPESICFKWKFLLLCTSFCSDCHQQFSLWVLLG